MCLVDLYVLTSNLGMELKSGLPEPGGHTVQVHCSAVTYAVHHQGRLAAASTPEIFKGV